MPIDQMRRTTANAIGIGGLLKSVDNVGVVGKAKVVIAAKCQQRFAVDMPMWLLWGVGDAGAAVEMPGTAGVEFGAEFGEFGISRHQDSPVVRIFR